MGFVTHHKQTSEESEIMVLLHQLQSMQMIEATFKKRLGLRHLKIGDVTRNLYGVHAQMKACKTNTS